MLNAVFGNPWVRAAGLMLALLLTALFFWFMSSVLVPLLMAFFVAYVFDPVVDRLERRRIPRLAAALGLMLVILLLLVCVPLVMLPQMVQEAESLVKLQPHEKTVVDRTLDKLPIEEWLELWDAARAEEHSVAEADGTSSALDARAATTETLSSDETEPLPHATADSATEEVSSAPEAGDGAEDSDVAQGVAEVANTLPEDTFYARAELARRIGEWISANAVNILRTHSGALAGFGKLAGSSAVGVFATVGNWILGLILLVGNFVLFAFVTIYLLKDYDDIVASAQQLVPERHRGKMREISAKIDQQLKAFMRGQFVVCCCLAAMYVVGLTVAGVPLAAALGIFGGLASFVPYLGIALTIGPAVLLALLKHGADWHLVVTVLTFVIAQAIEGNLLTPKIVGSQVGLGPVWVILAIMVFGSTMGFLGLLLAVPIAATLKVLVLELLALYRGSAFFTGKAESPSG